MTPKKASPLVRARFFSLSKKPKGFSDKGMRFAARLVGRKRPVDVRSARSVFFDVQKVNCPEGAREAALGRAAGKNNYDSFAPAGAKLRKAENGRFCNQIVTFSARWVYKGRESRYNAIC